MRNAKKSSERPPPHCRLTRPLARTFCICAIAIYAFAPASQSQSGGALPIRVESNEVWVPVLVLDKKLVGRLHGMDPMSFLREAEDHDSHLLEDLAVSGLSAADFHIFEDGREQKIDRVTLSHDFRPLGASGGGQGNWMGSARSYSYYYMGHVIHPPMWLTYLIGYTKPESPDGSCHEVELKVERRGSLVYSRPEYCNTKDSSTDPLKGTKLGRQMQDDLGSSANSKIPVALRALPFFQDTGSVYLDVVLDFPAKPARLRGDDCAKPPMVSLLAAVYTKDRALASRFSDVTSVGFDFRGRSLPLLAPDELVSCVLWGPSQYRTRLDLRPGEYRLEAVLNDESKFGRAEGSVTVESYDGKQLAISGIALSREYRQATPASDANAAPGEGYDPLVSGGLEVIPTADLRFQRSEPFTFFFQIYSPHQSESPAATVNARLQILDAKTGQVTKDLRPFSAAPFARPESPVIPVSGGIDISTLPSGSYQLEVQATDSSGQTTPWQSVAFSIE